MHRPLLPFLALAAASALLLAACTSEGNPISTPTQPPEQTATPTVSPSPEPTTRAPFVLPTPTPDPDLVHLAATVWLANLEDGALTTLTESLGTAPYLAEFTLDGGIRVDYNAQDEVREVTFDAAGNQLGDSPVRSRCLDSATGAWLDDRFYADTHCGPISPDGRFMTYAVTTDERTGDWDQWLTDLQTGETRLLQAGLRHCGGCDFRFGPRWSPSGRYLIVSELLDGGRVFLLDIEAGTSVDITQTSRATQLSEAPDWSPTEDRLLRSGPEDSTILEDLEAGSSIQLDDLPWPAAFDPTGTYAYSPAWAVSTEPGPHQRTTVVDATTGATIGKRPGTPPWERVWDATGDPIVATEGNFVAALTNSEQCDGTLIYNPGRPAAACLEGAVAPVFSPNTTLVAFARETGRTPPSTGPRMESFDGLPTWEVAVFNRITGETTVIAEGAAGSQFPDLTWNEDGTHLLIRWPNAFGL